MSDTNDDQTRLTAELASLRARVRELETRLEEEPLKALEEERDRAQRYLDVARVMLVGLDTDGRVTLANRMACEVLGYDHEQVIGQPWIERFVPAHAHEAVRTVLARIARGDIEYTEQRMGPVMTASGEIRAVWWQNAQIRDDQGRFTGSLSSGQDVTDHLSASDALRQSQDTMQAILAAMPDLVLHQDAEGRFLNCFKAPDVPTLLPVEEFIGRHMEDVLPKTMADSSRTLIEGVLRTGDVASVEYDLDMPDGTRTYDLRMAPVGNDEVVSVIRDVTEARGSALRLEESERRFRTLFEESPLGLVVVDRTGKVVTANRAMEELLGYAAGELPGRSFADLTHPDDIAGTRELVAKLRDGTSRSGSIEKRYLRKDGGVVYAKVRAVAHWDGSDTQARLFALVDDVTERRRTDALLSARTRQQSALAQFSQEALAGHDVRVLLQRACELLTETLHVEYAKVLELRPHRENLLLAAGVGWRDGLVGSATVSSGRDSQAGFTLLVREPVIVSDIWEEERFCGPPLLLDHLVVSGMSVTIQGDDGGAPYGVLGVHTSTRREFTADDVSFLNAFATALTTAIIRARREDEIEELNARLEARVLDRTRELDQTNKRLQTELAQRERTEAALHRTQSDRSQLMQRLLTIQEDEQAHIARELHDRAGQGLSSLLVGLRLLSRETASVELSDRLEALRNVTSETLESIRNLAFEMRPTSLDHLGLAATLEQDVRRLGSQMQIGVDFLAGTAEREPLPKDLEVAIYRAVHAALTNAAQHAEPANVSVTMQRQTKRLSIIVEDDGKGFDVETVSAGPVDKRFGLSAMEERVRPFGGRVNFESSPGSGTTVYIELPMDEGPRHEAD